MDTSLLQDNHWLDILSSAKRYVKKRNPSWGGLIINRKKPTTYRVFTQYLNDFRICLHKFDPCSTSETFLHPHQWPGAFCVLKGSYSMKISRSLDHGSDPIHLMTMVLNEGSSYVMNDPLLWHAIQPLSECYSIMINGKNYKQPHLKAPTTSGKNLTSMTPEEIEKQVTFIKTLL